MLTLPDLTEHNVNPIIPSYCHLPVSCRGLFDHLGAVSHRFNLILNRSINCDILTYLDIKRVCHIMGFLE